MKEITFKVNGNGHPKFYELLEEIANLHDNKNADYATSDDPLINFKREGKALEKYGLITEGDAPLKYALILMSKQIDGVYKMVGRGDTGKAESIKDKLKDKTRLCVKIVKSCYFSFFLQYFGLSKSKGK